jgi:tRNA threonylcarbamoyladenosine biosynthesis protein TsaE
MKENKEFIYTIDELDLVVNELCTVADQCSVLTFTGVLGAGKTTLIQRLLRRSGVEGVITSPTFTYVNVYNNNQGNTFYHFDCYRIPTLDAFLEAGFGEYLYQPKSWSFIEWPEVIRPLVSSKVCHINLDYFGDDKRVLVYRMVA